MNSVKFTIRMGASPAEGGMPPMQDIEVENVAFVTIWGPFLLIREDVGKDEFRTHYLPLPSIVLGSFSGSGQQVENEPEANLGL